jgi:hypothetical protein
MAKSYAPHTPNQSLQWFHFLSAVELKFKKMLAIPADLSPDEVQPTIPHQKNFSFTPPPAEPAVAGLSAKPRSKPCV